MLTLVFNFAANIYSRSFVVTITGAIILNWNDDSPTGVRESVLSVTFQANHSVMEVIGSIVYYRYISNHNSSRRI